MRARGMREGEGTREEDRGYMRDMVEGEGERDGECAREVT